MAKSRTKNLPKAAHLPRVKYSGFIEPRGGTGGAGTAEEESAGLQFGDIGLTGLPGETTTISTKTERVLFPFAGVVGQEKMKLALILNAIDPKIGGVLAQGQKGTAKSVSVRGIAELLPTVKVVDGCRFSCAPDYPPEKLCFECKQRFKYEIQELNALPREEREKRIKEGYLPYHERPMKVVDLPLGATEDRVLGSIDIEKVLRLGTKAFEPGILADVNQGILYVDEINLLDDYIVDVLLDAAAMGVATIEREGVSLSHPANFILVGTMNPEEGELRPQLLDRLALTVKIQGMKDIEMRTQIIKNARAFNENPHAFRESLREEQEWIKNQIVKARELLPNVVIDDRYLDVIAGICIDFNVDGHRADIIIERTARTHAAYNGRTEVTPDDIVAAAELALPHRMRKMPLEEQEFSYDLLLKLVEDYLK